MSDYTYQEYPKAVGPYTAHDPDEEATQRAALAPPPEPEPAPEPVAEPVKRGRRPKDD